MPDRDARFDALYATHRQTLHAYVLGRTGDHELALDLLQDIFVRAWRNLSMLEGLSTARQRAWLFSVARNLVIDQHRASTTRRTTDEALAREVAVANPVAVPAEEEAAHRERLAVLDNAIRQLPEDLRIVLVLQVVGGHTSNEIGEMLDRPPGTVRYQLSEARRRLAQELQA